MFTKATKNATRLTWEMSARHARREMCDKYDTGLFGYVKASLGLLILFAECRGPSVIGETAVF